MDHTVVLLTSIFVTLLRLCHGQDINSVLNQVFGEPQDYGKMTPELILDRGFQYERHHVTVPDGFVIGIHRIINPTRMRTRGTILLFHGIFGSASNFLNTDQTGYINEPPDFIGANIAFELSKRGFDCWLPDQRATFFSRENVLYSNISSQYWSWSLDEIALYDLPTIIDYITAFTGRAQIGYIGHSQGTTIMLYLLSRIPKYNQIIHPFIAAAPVFYLSDTILTRAPTLAVVPYSEVQVLLRDITAPIFDFEFRSLLVTLCRPPPIREAVCIPGFIVAASIGSYMILLPLPNLNLQRIPVFLTSSIMYVVGARQAAQYVQTIATGAPAQLGFTPEQNVRLYGQESAPIYDPRRITCGSMIFFSAVNDLLAAPKDVDHLISKMAVPPIAHFRIQDPLFQHLTFIFGDRDMVVKYFTAPALEILTAMYPEI